MSDGVKIFTVQPEDISIHWPRIVKFIETIQHGDLVTDEVKQYLMDGKAQLWGIGEHDIEAVWITKIEEEHGRKHAVVWAGAGDGLGAIVAKFIEHTEPWFKELGCEYMEIIGRRGWLRALPGLHEHLTIMRKPLCLH